jgi:hypothetical protein
MTAAIAATVSALEHFVPVIDLKRGTPEAVFKLVEMGYCPLNGGE